jgi:hypothetical protein
VLKLVPAVSRGVANVDSVSRLSIEVVVVIGFDSYLLVDYLGDL